MSDPSPPGTIYLPLNLREADDILGDLPLGQSVSAATRDFYVRLRNLRRRPQQAVPAPSAPDEDIVYAPIQPVRPEPETAPRAGHGICTRDLSGRHGLGFVCNIFIASDGAVAVRWLDGPPQGQPRWEFYDKPGTQPFEQLTKFDGDITIVWTDTKNDRPPGDNG